MFGARTGRVRGFWDLWRDCRRTPPSIIYAIGLRAAIVAAVLRLLDSRVRVVHGIRSTYPPGTQLARNFSTVERLLKGFTAAYVANSQQGALDLQRIAGVDPAKVHVIHNGVESRAPAAAAERRACRIVGVANINQYKGHLEFLNVARQLSQRLPELEVVLIGRNEKGPALIQEIEARSLTDVVRVAGFIAKPEELVGSARVFALPSPRIEGCPTAILEAMALGVPVVAFGIGGIPEIGIDGESGLLVPPLDYDGMASALQRLLTDVLLNDSFGAAARRSVQSKFTLEVCAERHLELWQSLCAGRKSLLGTAM